jgi:protoporphyrinogen oxidase
MVPDPDKACVGLEYFCFEGDSLWSKSNAELVELATEELAALGLAEPSKVERGHVVRVQKAYPMYDENYAERVAAIREWLDPIENLQQVGRNGLHRYNNSDHSMLTAIRAVENYISSACHDVWSVNIDSAYHEEHTPDEHPYRTLPDTPAMAEFLTQRQ